MKIHKSLLAVDPRTFSARPVRSVGGLGDALLFVGHDPRLKFATARVAVGLNAGSFQDRGVPGAAHFFEHCAYLGSARYPSPLGTAEFDRFLEQIGGATNAATFPTHTVFTGVVPFDQAAETVSRLLDMVQEPQLKPEAIVAEVSAIDAEHRKNLAEPGHRVWQTLMDLFNEPLRRFTTGNRATLLGDYSEQCARHDSLTAIAPAWEALKQYHDEDVDGCRPAVVVWSDKPVSAVEDTVVPVIQEALHRCKPARRRRPLRADDWFTSVPDLISRDRVGYLPLQRSPQSLISVIQVLPYEKAADEHPEIIPTLSHLIHVHRHFARALEHHFRAHEKLAKMFLADADCSMTGTEIDPLRLVTVECKFLNKGHPLSVSPGLIDAYQEHTEAFTRHYLEQLRAALADGTLDEFIETQHDYRAQTDRITPAPKVESTSDLIDFTKQFMTHAELQSWSRGFANIVSYIEGRSEVAPTATEFGAVVDRLLSNPRVSLVVSHPSTLSFLEHDKGPGYRRWYAKYHNPFYEHDYYEKRVSGAPSTSPTIKFAPVNFATVVGDPADVCEDVDLDVDPSTPVQKPPVLFVTHYVWPWTVLRLDFVGPRNVTDASAYLWALHLRDQLERHLGPSGKNCSAVFETRHAQQGRASLMYREPRRGISRNLQTVLDVIDEADKDQTLASTRVSKLILRDIVADHTTGNSFMHLYDHLMSLIDPEHVSFLHKFKTLMDVYGQDEVRLPGNTALLGLVQGGESLWDYEPFQAFADRFEPVEDPSPKWRIPHEHDEPVVVNAREALQHKRQASEHVHMLMTEMPTYMGMVPMNACQRSANETEGDTQLLHFIPIPFYAPPRSQFVQVHDELEIHLMNRLAGRCMAQKLSTELFNQLRNRDHVGYVVDSSFWVNGRSREYMGILVRVQSPDYDATQLLSKIRHVTRRLETVCNEEELQQALAGLLAQEDDIEKAFDLEWSLTWDRGFGPATKHRKALERAVGDMSPALLRHVLTHLRHHASITIFE